MYTITKLQNAGSKNDKIEIKTGNFSIIVGDFNTSLTEIEIITIQKNQQNLRSEKHYQSFQIN